MRKHVALSRFLIETEYRTVGQGHILSSFTHSRQMERKKLENRMIAASKQTRDHLAIIGFLICPFHRRATSHSFNLVPTFSGQWAVTYLPDLLDSPLWTK